LRRDRSLGGLAKYLAKEFIRWPAIRKFIVVGSEVIDIEHWARWRYISAPRKKVV
jgi:hypothetical protein